MYTIGKVRLVRQDLAAPGTILLRQAGHASSPILTILDKDEDGEHLPLFIPLAARAGGGMAIQYRTMNGGLWLTVDRWELRVDLDTAYTGMQDMPQPGDAFISDGTAGFNATINHGEAFVSIGGQLLQKPNWGEGYVGFRKWEIVTWPTNDEDAKVIAQWDRAKK